MPLTEPRRLPLRVLLLVLAASGLLPLALASAIGLFVLDSHQREQTRRLGIETARALSTAVDAELDRAVAVLQALGGGAELRAGDMGQFRTTALHVIASQPDWLLIALANGDGEPLLSTRDASDAKPSAVVEPESLQRIMRERVPVIGSLQRGPGGNHAVAVRVPVMQEGRLRYVLSGALKPDAFLEVVKRQRVRPEWVISIFDARGARVARSRAHEQSLGMLATPSLRQLVARSSEGWDVTHTLEGDAVATAFSRSAESGWMVAVGIPEPQLRAGAARTLAAYGGGLLVSFALGLLAVVLIARRITIPMASLRAAARTVARRETPVVAPTRVAEIREVGDALVEAGAERARIEAQRERLLDAEIEARAAAERANRSKDEFVSMLSHELRNPIAAIANAARLLASANVEDSVAMRAREVISRQATQLARLADDLLMAENAVQGRIVLETRSVDLAVCAREALEGFLAAGGHESHRITTQLSPVRVVADPLRLAQIITRLLDNAFKFTPANGTIRMATGADGGQGVLTLTDTGSGMTPELTERVFELFAQAEREPHRPEGGLGIGLTLVRRLVELHGGTVSARSPGPGKGSEFEVRLPRAPEPTAEPSAAPARAAPQPRNVLVVEDNDDARATLRLLLEAAGHRVRVAADGVEGLQAVLDERPDVALVDIGLPRMDGYEVARRIHEALGNAARPFLVAVTGYGLPADKRRALSAGFDVHLVKPIDYPALEGILARLA